ncbi:GNAT family N-acetyltransferase [Burkholderia pyrrocinia]|uniref:GNAT family N-acetyltransferase n=1 Tax=Burkholderia pyrrocinia TaxID=60550 RepID=UPI001BCC14EE|nr:GNAT family N-acetyltransferase [Burkholderia pyrrocinia]
MRDDPTSNTAMPNDALESGRGQRMAPSNRRRVLSVAWARHQDEVEQAQRLRYRVFAEEMGASLTSGTPGIDADRFDPYCDHLIVRDEDSQEIVGTYRVLLPHRAREIGALYAESEFDLRRLAHLKPRMLELGRSCVHRNYRSGSTIMALWSGLGDYSHRWGIETMLGCASVPMKDGGHYAASLYREFTRYAEARGGYEASPILPLQVGKLDQCRPADPPALLKGYLRLGARVCSAPAWDPAFNVADFLTLLHMSEMSPRYARHFLGPKSGN